MHHGEKEGQIFACPVKAMAIQVAHIQVDTSDGPKTLCGYWKSVGRGDITDRDMIFHMKYASAKLGYPIRNVPLDSIDTRPNRVGGACAMKLAGFDDGNIRKKGKWLPSSNSFLGYIQQ